MWLHVILDYLYKYQKEIPLNTESCRASFYVKAHYVFSEILDKSRLRLFTIIFAIGLKGDELRLWTIYAPRGRRTNKWVAVWRRGVENFHNKESATAIIFSGDPPKVFICLNSRDGKKTYNNSWWLQPDSSPSCEKKSDIFQRVPISNNWPAPLTPKHHNSQHSTHVRP